MKIFAPLYEKVMLWSTHKNAPYYLYFTAFIESIFWPIPVDIMLAPMALAKRHLAWRLAFCTTIFSVLGGAAGYYLGSFLYEPDRFTLHRNDELPRENGDSTILVYRMGHLSYFYC